MNWLKRNWWTLAIVAIAIYLYKPNWLKFKHGGGPVGGPVGGTIDKPAAGGGDC